ncbi:MAG: glycosyltransferase family 2 protein [Bacteroidales bacterium]|nr:glycosyltransferase family 2 protein [Bacteroidales bacterium]
MKITGIITTLNEEQNIVDCIRSLQQVCDEVVVTDSYSKDKTVALAQQAGAKVYQHEYIGDGPQKNLALPYTSNDWVISIDADERLSEELVAAMHKIDWEKIPYDGFAVRRRNLIGERWVKCCRWYPDYLVRIFRKDKLRFVEQKQHAFVPKSNISYLEADLIHYRYKSYDDLFSKRNYSTRGAKILFLQGKKANAFTPFLHGFSAFVVNYFFHGGIFSGVDGYVLSKAIAHNSFLKYAKLLEYCRDASVREAEDWTSVW